jgi:hypothetical protein
MHPFVLLVQDVRRTVAAARRASSDSWQGLGKRERSAQQTRLIVIRVAVTVSRSGPPRTSVHSTSTFRVMGTDNHRLTAAPLPSLRVHGVVRIEQVAPEIRVSG